MPATPVILLPPSEGQAEGGTGAPWGRDPSAHAFPGLDASRRKVAGRLATAMRRSLADRRKLLGVGDAAVKAATAANLAVLEAATLPAIERYTGVLYDALDYADLPPALRRRIDAQTVIFSGLFGAVVPTDPLPEHKLKMGASLPRLGRLSTWWRPQLTETLAPMCDGRVVWDLLPNEHAAAWSPDETGLARRVTVSFVDDVERDGERRQITVSHWNKLLKGALVRHVVTHQLSDVDALAEFSHPEGYRYDPGRTLTEGRHTSVVLVARR